jgi:hypothetical protein
MNKKLFFVLLCAMYIVVEFSLHTQTLGDVNRSGGIDIVDALLTAQYYVGLNPQNFDAAYADVNCSGSIDIVDALLIAQFYVGLITTFPCSSPTPASTFHVFLLLGQSNMAGYPKAQDADKV